MPQNNPKITSNYSNSTNLVICGGGVQYRYRSCSNPHPRAGGKTCKGEDFDEHPCNLNNCQCKIINLFI